MRTVSKLALALTVVATLGHAELKGSPVGEAASVSSDLKPGPFRFREIYMLENRIESRRQNKAYDPNHSEELQSRTYYGLANPFLQDRADRRFELRTYAGSGWAPYVEETDGYREMGGLQLAETQYLQILGFLQKAQGPAASDVSLMLDHLGEFYLEERNFDKAYDFFTQSVEVRRKSLGGASCPASLPAGGTPQTVMSPVACRLHLSDLLTRLAEMDLGSEDFKRADAKLSEAVAIVNESQNLRYTDGLYAIYFQSISFERQARWKEAEALWATSVKLREGSPDGAAYWDAEREMAAFYARHGNFRAGAMIAARVEASAEAKTAKLQRYHTPLDNRPNRHYEQYRALSGLAMNEILAVDAWRTSGAQNAAGLLEDLADRGNESLLMNASDAEQTELLAWFAQRAYLHMSILLDGEPTQARIDKAYTLLSEVKGNYLATSGQISQLVQSNRNNPGISGGPEVATRDQLAAARRVQARLFLGVALDHQEYDPVQFMQNDDKLRILSTALATQTANSLYSSFSVSALSKTIPTGAAFLDFAGWQRTMRDGRISAEYSAFVVRAGMPVRHISLGPAAPINSDIDALHPTRRPQSKQRAMQIAGTQIAPPRPVDWTRLGSLYEKVLTPIEKEVEGVSDLYIAPDGKLTMAPFSALQTGNVYELQSRSVTYVGSWRDMMQSQTFEDKWSSLPVVVANPDFNLDLLKAADGAPERFGASPGEAGLVDLDQARAEADDVAHQLGLSSKRVLTGTAARKQLVQSLESPGLLHLATHSVADLGWTPHPLRYRMLEFPQPLDTQFPLLQSVIAFAGANRPQEGEEDGLMTGLEASSLDLARTSLVVLSSCESGRGSVLDGQGVLGLRAAFSIAGAKSMVMTLWPVDDEAGRQLMDIFYGHLVTDTAVPARALRLAQLDMRKNPKYSDPFYWAGYVASGYPVQEAGKRSTLPNEKATTAEAEQRFVTPNCYEIHAHDSNGDDVQSTEIRVTISGIVRLSQSSPHMATFNLNDSGNQVEVKTRDTLKGVLIDGSEKDLLASERNWASDLIVERQKEFSSVSFRFGLSRADPSQRRTITLKGSSELFPNLGLPLTLPPLSAYMTATDSQKGQIDSVGLCRRVTAESHGAN